MNTYNINNYDPELVGKFGVIMITGPIAYSKVILENKDKYKLRIYDNYYDIGLVYDKIKNRWSEGKSVTHKEIMDIMGPGIYISLTCSPFINQNKTNVLIENQDYKS